MREDILRTIDLIGGPGNRAAPAGSRESWAVTPPGDPRRGCGYDDAGREMTPSPAESPDD